MPIKKRDFKRVMIYVSVIVIITLISSVFSFNVFTVGFYSICNFIPYLLLKDEYACIYERVLRFCMAASVISLGVMHYCKIDKVYINSVIPTLLIIGKYFTMLLFTEYLIIQLKTLKSKEPNTVSEAIYNGENLLDSVSMLFNVTSFLVWLVLIRFFSERGITKFVVVSLILYILLKVVIKGCFRKVVEHV